MVVSSGDRPAQGEVAEGSHRLGLVEEVFRAGVAEVVAELHDVDAQHHGERVGPPPAAGFRVVGRDGCFEPLPQDEAVQPLKELLAARRVAILLELDPGECGLMHGTLPSLLRVRISPDQQSAQYSAVVPTFPELP